MITKTNLDGYIALHCWSMLRLVRTTPVSSYIVKSSVQTRHNHHTVHDYPAHHGNDRLMGLVNRVD